MFLQLFLCMFFLTNNSTVNLKYMFLITKLITIKVIKNIIKNKTDTERGEEVRGPAPRGGHE